MKKSIATGAAAIAAALAQSSPALAAGQNPPTSCGLGFVISPATQQLGGIGQAAHQLGFGNLGNDVFQEAHAIVKSTC